jgi:hypothetical protein
MLQSFSFLLADAGMFVCVGWQGFEAFLLAGGRADGPTGGRGSFCVCWQAFDVQERSISDSFWQSNQFLSSFFRTPT